MSRIKQNDESSLKVRLYTIKHRIFQLKELNTFRPLNDFELKNLASLEEELKKVKVFLLIKGVRIE
jgi:hypothetical protein